MQGLTLLYLPRHTPLRHGGLNPSRILFFHLAQPLTTTSIPLVHRAQRLPDGQIPTKPYSTAFCSTRPQLQIAPRHYSATACSSSISRIRLSALEPITEHGSPNNNANVSAVKLGIEVSKCTSASPRHWLNRREYRSGAWGKGQKTSIYGRTVYRAICTFFPPLNDFFHTALESWAALDNSPRRSCHRGFICLGLGRRER